MYAAECLSLNDPLLTEQRKQDPTSSQPKAEAPAHEASLLKHTTESLLCF
jgi:hypothetical protein